MGTRASKTSFGVVAEVPKAAIVAVGSSAFVDIYTSIRDVRIPVIPCAALAEMAHTTGCVNTPAHIVAVRRQVVGRELVARASSNCPIQDHPVVTTCAMGEGRLLQGDITDSRGLHLCTVAVVADLADGSGRDDDEASLKRHIVDFIAMLADRQHGFLAWPTCYLEAWYGSASDAKRIGDAVARYLRPSVPARWIRPRR